MFTIISPLELDALKRTPFPCTLPRRSTDVEEATETTANFPDCHAAFFEGDSDDAPTVWREGDRRDWRFVRFEDV